MQRLRAPDGCPWDREQSHDSLKPYLREEAAELLDAIDERDDAHLAEELGDVLLQVVFHCQIASEEGRFDLQAVARTCCDKLIRRHPHVFGDRTVDDAAGVLRQWEDIKRGEVQAAARHSALSGVPLQLSALHRAQKMQKKAAKVGFDWPDVQGVIDKIDEEAREVREAIASGDEEQIAEEIGDLLFSTVNLSRVHNRHAEDLLHRTIRKFETRFHHMERVLDERGQPVEQCSLDELEQLWMKAKEDMANNKPA